MISLKELKWNDARIKVPDDQKLKEDGFHWIKVLAYADNGVEDYLGEANYYWYLNKWDLPLDAQRKEHLDKAVIAWMPMIDLPKIKSRKFDRVDMIEFAKYFKEMTKSIPDSDLLLDSYLDVYMQDRMICQRCQNDPCECHA